jgi:anti-sigma regulatory factor (Ser/Thr protein kinase)
MKITHPERRNGGKERNSGSKGGLLLRLELPSNPALLCAVRGAIERLTESFGFSPEDCRAVTRAVDEALTNIIRHAYCGRADRPIELIINSIHNHPNSKQMIPSRPVQLDGSNTAEGLEILICDRGPAIKPEQMCMRALEEVKAGGLGLHFIQQSMDVVEYARAKGTNRLRLVKYVHAPKQGVTS